MIPRPDWLDPREYPPPHGTIIRLYTIWGTDREGLWNDRECVGWLHKANTSPELKKLRAEKFAAFFKTDTE